MTAPITRKPFKRKRRLPLPEEVAVWIVLLIGAFTIGLGIGLDVGSPNCILPAGLLVWNDRHRICLIAGTNAGVRLFTSASKQL